MATAAEKKADVKQRIQQLRNMCKDMQLAVMDEGTMPEAVAVREAIEKLQALIDLLDGKKKSS